MFREVDHGHRSEIGRRGRCDHEHLKAATTELLNAGLIVRSNADDDDQYELTEAGCEIYNKLVQARREHLAELWPEWSPDKREEVAKILRRLARELVPERRAA